MKSRHIKSLKNHNTPDFDRYYNNNICLLSLLVNYKSKIEDLDKNDWEEYKKYTNDYELVFTCKDFNKSVSKYIPISRSFFKLWEMIHEYEYFFNGDENKCYFMAEGPGGFVEAYSKWRGKKLYRDSIYVTTLIDDNDKNIPHLKIPLWIKKKPINYSVIAGCNNDGNLCDFDNIKSIVSEIGRNSCNIITADGGFDFSSDFNNQETMSNLLIACEIFLALQLQKSNGTFVLKMYDISNITTIKLLSILYQSYSNVYFAKPSMSRPANSEKYIICTNFNELASKKYIETLSSYIEKRNIIQHNVNSNLMYSIYKYNKEFVWNQIIYIMKTMNYISKKTLNVNMIHEYQVKKAKKWCSQYSLPFVTGY